MRPLVPRPHHEETSWEEQEAWKKKLATAPFQQHLFRDHDKLAGFLGHVG
jgi:hypothetical protein